MDRLQAVEIENFRSIKSLTLWLDGLQVLIGENGGGKSSIVECFEILRKATAPQFAQELERVHGGPRAMLRHGESTITLTARIALEPGEGRATYRLSFGGQAGWGLALFSEQLIFHGTTDTVLFDLVQGRPVTTGVVEVAASTGETVLPYARLNGIVDRVWKVLSTIDVHLGHEVTALWRQRERARAGVSNSASASLRDASQLSAAKRLERGAANLASIYQHLKNGVARAEWEVTRRLVQLGLGDTVEDVAVDVVTDGFATLALRYADGRVIPAMALSDGQLAFLAFVAMTRSSAPRSVLVVDEPELHLHPGLVVRVLDLLAGASAQCPVIIATHSGDILDALDDPEEQVLVVTHDGAQTVVAPMRKGFLEAWRPQTLSELRRSMGDEELKEQGPLQKAEP